MKSNLLMVRHGRVNVKFRAEQAKLLPRIQAAIVTASSVQTRTAVDLGPFSAPGWLAIAHAWTSVPPEDYVLPSDKAAADNGQRS